MSSEAFVVSTANHIHGPTALQQAIELAGLRAPQIQDLVVCAGRFSLPPELKSLNDAAGLQCTSALISPDLRAIFFAASSILSEDVDLLIVAGFDGASTAVSLLASPDAVGRHNLLPRARIAARSLAGPDEALRQADLTAADVELSKAGEPAVHLLNNLLDEMDDRSLRWGILSADPLAMLVERL